MDVNDVVKTLEDSKIYKDFIKDNKDHHLAHLFNMSDDVNDSDWQLGYYGKNTDKITVFDCFEDGRISIMPPQEAFKEDNYIQPLDISKVKISKLEAHNKVTKVLKQNYSAEMANKMIMLLQNLPEFGQIWNVTVITATFSVINVKINAETGALVKHSKESLLGWKKE